MSAKETAISDIKTELHKAGKVFIAYNPMRNKAIRNLTKEYINSQKQLDK